MMKVVSANAEVSQISASAILDFFKMAPSLQKKGGFDDHFFIDYTFIDLSVLNFVVLILLIKNVMILIYWMKTGSIDEFEGFSIINLLRKIFIFAAEIDFSIFFKFVHSFPKNLVELPSCMSN